MPDLRLHSTDKSIISIMTINKSLALSALALLGSLSLSAQTATTYRPVLTAVPSLQISPDARAAGLGDQGVATTADPYAQFWNPAKYAFASSKAGVSLSYTPWLSQIVDDVALMQVTGYYQLGAESTQALGASVRYFSLGKMTRWDEMGNSLGDAHPNEFAVDLSYSLKLSEAYSMAVALRYINSNQDISGESNAGNAVAADIAGYMNKYIILGGAESLWTVGFNIKNIGSKISYDGGTTSSFIPANLSLGTGILYPIDEYNMISFNVEANKLLVPQQPIRSDYESDQAFTDAIASYRNMSGISGIFNSLGDAKGGLSEEFKEIRWSLGAEYNYNDKFFLRAGYSYLDPSKGNLQAFTAGAGFRMSAFRIDASYMMSTVQQNPLDQTLRFTLGFDLEGLRNLFN